MAINLCTPCRLHLLGVPLQAVLPFNVWVGLIDSLKEEDINCLQEGQDLWINATFHLIPTHWKGE